VEDIGKRTHVVAYQHEIKLALVFLGYFLKIAGDDELVRSQLLGVRPFCFLVAQRSYFRAERPCPLHTQVSESSDADNSHFLARPYFVVLERRVRCDTRTEQWRRNVGGECVRDGDSEVCLPGILYIAKRSVHL
jgi:hypothetical protein